jgi:hypothetical protein
MFRPRTPRYPLLQAYLTARPMAPRVIVNDRTGLIVASVTSAAVTTQFLAMGSYIVGSICAGLTAILGVRAYQSKPPPPPSPEEQLARQADTVVTQLKQYAYLHRAFHPAVGATLEECAGYWTRIVAALDGPLWTGNETLPQWAALRQEALTAAALAMDEALVHAGTTLAFVQPTKPLEHVSDALEDIGFGPLVKNDRAYEPMPPSFRPVRELAERLRELAERCETAATQRRQESPEPVSAAFRRLDAALGEMRHLEEAEGELRQGA